MRIITGHRGTPHVTSNDEQGKNQGIFGIGNYVLNVGQKFNATMTDATTVTLEDGEGMMQGVHFRIDPGTTEAISISAGTTGYNRIDLVCARYTKDITTGIEDVSLIVIEGTPNASTPSAPSYNTGDVLDGDVLADFPLWKVTLSGLTPSLSKMYTPGRILTFPIEEKVTDSISVSVASSGYYGQIFREYTLPAGIYCVFVGSKLTGTDTSSTPAYDTSVGIYQNEGTTELAVAGKNNGGLIGLSYVQCFAFLESSSDITFYAFASCKTNTNASVSIDRWIKVIKMQ